MFFAPPPIHPGLRPEDIAGSTLANHIAGGPIDWDRPSAGWNRVMMIGEAAGKDEVRQSRPFVGAAGRTFDEILKAANWRRDQTLIGNTFRYRPVDNDIDLFFVPKSSPVAALTLPPRESKRLHVLLAREIDHLESVIRRTKPAFIVTLGKISTWAVAETNGDLGITKIRGQIFPNRLAADLDIPVLAMLHPSFVLRRRAEAEKTGVDGETPFRQCVADLVSLAPYLRRRGASTLVEWDALDDLTSLSGGRDDRFAHQVLDAYRDVREMSATLTAAPAVVETPGVA